MLKMLRDENGSAIVILAISFTLILGLAALVIDAGLMYYTRSQLQNAADAAALAEAQDIAKAMVNLHTDGVAAMAGITLANAETKVDEYAVLNGLQPENLTAAGFIYLNDTSNTFNGIPIGIKVAASKNVDFGFARIFGNNSKVIGAHAEAQAGVVTGAIGVAPLSILDGDNSEGDPVDMIKNNNNGNGSSEEELKNLTSGWFGYVKLEDKSGASFISDQILNGATMEVTTGQIPGIPGMKSGDINDNSVIGKLRDKCLAQCEHRLCKVTTGYDEDCPRLRIIPVVEVIGGNGANTQLNILGFALCLLDPPAKYDAGWELRGEYIRGVTPGATSINVNAIGTVSDYGNYGFLLTE